MRSLTEINPSFFAELLGAECPGCTAGTPGNRIDPDPNKRVVFVGLGGSGLKTLEAVKKWVTENMTPNWKRYIGFLGVDCDWREMENLSHLDEQELIRITCPRMREAVGGDASYWPEAWRHICGEREIRSLPMQDGESTHGSRLKAKLMFRFPGMGGAADQRFFTAVRKLACLDVEMPPIMIEVYVVAGLAGGMGSGLAPEMAALIRRALWGRMVEVHGIFYTPDGYIPMQPMHQEQLAANGFAALKELNYIEELKHRPEESLLVPVSDPAQGFFLRVSVDGAGYDTVALMEAEYRPDRGVRMFPMETAVQHMISVLLDNSPHPRRNLPDFVPTEPARNYPAAMDFAMVDSVEIDCGSDLVWAWRTACLCEKAGFLPVSKQERAARIAAGETVLPFLAEDQFLPADTVSQQVSQLTHALLAYMGSYQTSDFHYAEVIHGGAPTWEQIREGLADDHHVSNAAAQFTEQTICDAGQILTEGIRREFRRFREMAMQYTEEYGPMAFVNLYLGKGIPGPDGAHPRGIREILNLLADGRNPTNGNPMVFPVYQEYWSRNRKITCEIRDVKDSPLNRVIYRGRREAQAMDWMDSFDGSVNARINEQRRQLMLGKCGILRREFLEPAEKMVARLSAMGHVLGSMTQINRMHGAPLSDAVSFSQWADARRCGMAWAADPVGYQALMTQLRTQVNRIDPVLFRRGILNAFWEQPEQWLEFDSDRMLRDQIRPRLANPRIPLPARRFFDQAVRAQAGACEADLSAMLIQTGALGAPLHRTIDLLLGKLWGRMRALPSGASGVYRLLYPDDLDWRVSPQASTILANIAAQHLGNVVCLPTADHTRLQLVHMELGMEARQMTDILLWRDLYRRRLDQFGSGLHGFGPGRSPSGRGGYPWNALPDLQEQPWPDPADQESAERLRSLVEKACSLDLIQLRQSPASGRWGAFWLDLGREAEQLYAQLDQIGFRELCAMMEKGLWSHGQFDGLMRPIRMNGFGIYSEDARTKEEALRLAEQILRISPYICGKLEAEAARTREWWDAWPLRHPEFRQSVMLRALASGLLRENGDGAWALCLENGREILVDKLDGKSLLRLEYRAPDLAVYGRNGMRCWLLFRSFSEKIPQRLFLEICEQAEETLRDQEKRKADPQRLQWVLEECERVQSTLAMLRMDENWQDALKFYEQLREELRITYRIL